MQLDMIGSRNGTDKASKVHGFLGFYEQFFEERRDDVFTLVEIGVYRGQSLKTWGEYFRNATCVGIDITQGAAAFVELDNTHVHIGDASRLEVLDEVIEKFGPPSIVVDDGSHLWHHQIDTLRYLWPRLLPGGYFVMEDVHTSFPALAAEYRGCSRESAYDYMMRLQRWLVGNRHMGAELPDDGFIANYWPSVRSMHWFRGTCVMHKQF